MSCRSFVALPSGERFALTKPFQGLGPTGKTYELTAMEWFEIQGNLIHRRRGARDAASQYRQLAFFDDGEQQL